MAIQATKQTGVDMTVEIMLDGTIRLVPVPEPTPPAPPTLSPFDQWLATYGARNADEEHKTRPEAARSGRKTRG